MSKCVGRKEREATGIISLDKGGSWQEWCTECLKDGFSEYTNKVALACETCGPRGWEFQDIEAPFLRVEPCECILKETPAFGIGQPETR